MKLSDIKPYENNPRLNDKAVDKVAASIKNFGFQAPIIVDKNHVIIAGHTRYKAAKKLGLKDVPVIVAENLSDEQVKAYRLADNKTGEFAEWDDELLAGELEDILGIDMTQFGFDLDGDEESEDNPYSKKVSVPQYEITGECPDVKALVDVSKTEELIEAIENSGVSEEDKKFLIEAAHRHSVFNYQNIAEYYAHGSEELQELMERSALVIIDMDDAIANGYTNLSDAVLQMMEE